MARDPQVTCSRETYGRLEKTRKESKMKWVDFLKLCGVSRSQWDCIRNSKPMGQAIYQRIADNLKIDYVWLMFGAVGDIAGYPQPIHDAGYPLPAEHPKDNGKAVKVMETYEYEESGRKATISIKDGKYSHIMLEGVKDYIWTFDDWMFLGEVAQEIKRLVQG